MKMGFRKPSIKRSIKARTTGRLKRQIKSSINPFYGKKGMGLLRNPRRAVYNAVYHQTTVGASDVIKSMADPANRPTVARATKQQHSGLWSFLLYAFILFMIGASIVKTYPVPGWIMVVAGACYFFSYFVLKGRQK